MNLLGTCWIDPLRQSPWTLMFGSFTQGTVPPQRSYSLVSCFYPTLFVCSPSPAHSRRRLLGHESFLSLQVLLGSPTTDAALPRHFACAYRLAYAGCRPATPSVPPEVTRCSSVPCHPQTPWCGGVNENAFASIVQARPCPTFGRPVHRRGSPHRLRPDTSPHALRIPSRDRHPALRSTAGGGFRSALACFRLSLSCPFRLRHTFHLSGPRGITPAFGYGAPHSSARGTLTLLNNALLSAHFPQADFSDIRTDH